MNYISRNNYSFITGDLFITIPTNKIPKIYIVEVSGVSDDNEGVELYDPYSDSCSWYSVDSIIKQLVDGTMFQFYRHLSNREPNKKYLKLFFDYTLK